MTNKEFAQQILAKIHANSTNEDQEILLSEVTNLYFQINDFWLGAFLEFDELSDLGDVTYRLQSNTQFLASLAIFLSESNLLDTITRTVSDYENQITPN